MEPNEIMTEEIVETVSDVTTPKTMHFHGSTAVVIGGTLLTGAAAYLIYKLVKRKKREKAEAAEDVCEAEEETEDNEEEGTVGI